MQVYHDGLALIQPSHIANIKRIPILVGMAEAAGEPNATFSSKPQDSVLRVLLPGTNPSVERARQTAYEQNLEDPSWTLPQLQTK